MSLGGFCVLILLFRTRRVRDVRAQVPELVAEVKQDLSRSSARVGPRGRLREPREGHRTQDDEGVECPWQRRSPRSGGLPTWCVQGAGVCPHARPG